MSAKEIMNKDEMARTLNRMVFQILEAVRGEEGFCLVGIRKGGATLAKRMADILAREGVKNIRLGYLDITLYRDDLSSIHDYPVLHSTELNFDVTGQNIVLVDDVIYTGRTTRAALDALIDLGRPKKILLAAFIDRGHRELPIQPDFTGKTVPTSRSELVDVKLEEDGGTDCITINKKA
ncbi:bifunctional pyr operon transcriptional regulator/uracil phosphoribosyltransferase PyrR [Seleniivibrio woodruffii]|uniref:Bifunctional protein PyrR n=1 Tax=Seleniivibrio woodruffii TaxID=1078050 RepID=A0A4R1K8W5_9BACT|nr:bifunctional pyr operon transcriptional regulator/uracil phosphoribosyltransferase PyrR [Seleniivibrio woodruffii]TCK60774.1 pyrimidine operon attenuation protein/uracil phosphoribosyltransferase [Seleniivibrio woodruffii]TVZ36404.1 pyrimidine operon attenuation protein/uracil phosphoribosyltransferase [Seleniivibrio woodruffii]